MQCVHYAHPAGHVISITGKTYILHQADHVLFLAHNDNIIDQHQGHGLGCYFTYVPLFFSVNSLNSNLNLNSIVDHLKVNYSKPFG